MLNQKPTTHLTSVSCKTILPLLETLPGALFLLDETDTIVYANTRAQTLTGFSTETLIGANFWGYAAPLVSPSLYQAVQEIKQSREAIEVAYVAPVTNRWLQVSLSPTDEGLALFILEQQEAPLYTGREIIESKRTEAEIHAIIDIIPHFIWIMHPCGSCDYCNQQWCDYTQLTVEQLQGDGWLQSLHPDDQQHILVVWQRAIETGTPCEAEYRLRNGKTGAYHWFLAKIKPLRDQQGIILRWVGICTNIDDRKRYELELKTTEQNFRILAEMVPQLVWTMWPDGRLDYTNQRYRDVTQADFSLEGDDIWRQFVHPDDIEHTLALRHQLLRTGEIYENEYRINDRRTGKYRWYLARALPICDEKGQVVKWFGTSTNIEKQKRIEQSLRESQERASALMNSNIIGINIIEGGQIVDTNDTFLHMTGYTREELSAGHINCLRMTSPEYLPRTLEAQQELAIKQSLTPYEKEYICKDGSRLPVLVGGVALKHHPNQAIAFVLDNSARKELEQRKDAFISMASHELRNPLTALKMQISLLHRQLTRQGLQVSALSGMQTQINKITRLVEELLDVSKIQAGKLEYRQESVDLDALLQETAEIMQHTHPNHRILIRGAVQTNLLGDYDRLGQVFTNLLSNAIKYSPGTETIEVDLSTSTEKVMIRVTDHGLGIPCEQRDKIFDRFYRVTGPRQKSIPGLGVGLYIVAEIVKHHGGTITVDSEVGTGSTFTVTLPRKSEA